MWGAMSPLARTTTGVAGLAAGVGVVLSVMLPGTPPAPPVIVTSDTRVFCQHLSHKLSDMVRVSPRPPELEVLTLGDEGRHLCDIGEIRGGILRLRRGMMLLTHDLDERNEP
jgi:hypothetical protein